MTSGWYCHRSYQPGNILIPLLIPLYQTQIGTEVSTSIWQSYFYGEPLALVLKNKLEQFQFFLTNNLGSGFETPTQFHVTWSGIGGQSSINLWLALNYSFFFFFKKLLQVLVCRHKCNQNSDSGSSS
jgi:hypothetical protein